MSKMKLISVHIYPFPIFNVLSWIIPLSIETAAIAMLCIEYVIPNPVPYMTSSSVWESKGQIKQVYVPTPSPFKINVKYAILFGVIEDVRSDVSKWQNRSVPMENNKKSIFLPYVLII